MTHIDDVLIEIFNHIRFHLDIARFRQIGKIIFIPFNNIIIIELSLIELQYLPVQSNKTSTSTTEESKRTNPFLVARFIPGTCSMFLGNLEGKFDGRLCDK